MSCQDKYLGLFSNITIPAFLGYKNAEVTIAVIQSFLKGKTFIWKYLERGMVYSLPKVFLFNPYGQLNYLGFSLILEVKI